MSFADKYLGAGPSREFTLENRTDVELVTGAENVRQAVITVMNTEAASPTGFGGERVFNRNVGLNLRQFLFTSDSLETRELFKQELLRIELFVPQIVINRPNLDVYASEIEGHKWTIHFPYTLVATGTPDNLIVGILAKDGYARLLPNAN